MNKLVKIQVENKAKQLTIKEVYGKRVVTLKEVDELHLRADGTARRNFNENKKHLVEGEDYFVRNSYEARSEFGITAPNGLVLLTESGYLMLVKSFSDDLAWQVQRQLVNTYFRVQESNRDTVKALLAATKNIIAAHELMEERVDDIENRLDTQITLDSGQQRRLQQAINKKVCTIEPDKAERGELFRQIHREIKDRWQVASYKDVLRQELQDVLNYVEAWKPIRRAS
ncbi:ORF6N domain-containing protein [Paenibacillus sp. D2_2]|uniref:ORF6N domain-containing protein n=1 Tax=Paenibacillus sp. D2_2 TaxID=3073092 RepID=UPI002815C574|nr:ORF6N domain-containing protein [Paenibacillus sp. D2_2]WMT42799.1 ORF6N domain-containing protein [Paenibacillus sp. D2_2]